jgi:hypothetical protein
MAKKAQKHKSIYRKDDLWIAPSLSLKTKNYQGDWKLQRGEPDETNRYLQLADVALGRAPVERRPKRRA